uniref:Na_H_Exchanger domain-containing protein n=1 Tax=Caenorhabditis japonica TaxID=281687 RepID=A0A8R1HWC7_CAEJA
MSNAWPGAKAQAASFFKNNHVNEIVTFLIIAAGFYVTLVSVTGQNFLHPLSPVTSNTLNLQNAANEILHSIISCFMMTVLSVVAGKIVKFVYIPTLIGCMLVGIAMRNIPEFGELFYINEYWQFILRKLALVVIIIRWGISINVRFISKNYIFPPILGIGSAFAEALAIACTACFLFNFPPSLSIICGFVVATVSPAVGMPTMLRIKEKGIGTIKNIPDVVPAACCFDNVTSLLIFSLTAAVTFTHDAMFPTFVKSTGAIVLAAIIGCLIGWLIRWFPKNDNRHTHFARFSIIASSTYAVITSMLMLGYPFPGIVAGLCLCCVSTTKWREDNPRGV